MTPSRRLACIRATIGREEATETAVRAVAPSAPPSTRELHYPYYWFVFRSTAATILGPRTTGLSCLVDGRTGLPATSDPFDVVTRLLPKRDVLEPALGESRAHDIARRFVAHASRARRRGLVTERIELLHESLVHKPFFVVTSEPTSLLVDGVTGALHPLGAEAPSALGSGSPLPHSTR